MKAVLISIRPKWCELIASGKKTIEVRKTRPKMEPPFKCYIYCTSGWGMLYGVNGVVQPLGEMTLDLKQNNVVNELNESIIGEFTCRKIEAFWVDNTFDSALLSRESGVSRNELRVYSQPKDYVYGWHISDLVIYDKPKELSEFKGVCKRTYCYQNCEKYSTCRASCKYIISRPPQQWMYVEELE